MQEFLQEVVFELQLCISILVSAVLGFVIGLERKRRGKEAGIRTHTIMCIGSCLFMVISLNLSKTLQFDPARIAAQIIPGIGFLGAGMIIFKKNEIHGLTTAAGIWCTAGVGMSCGANLYVIAIVSTIIIMLAQWLLHTDIKIFAKKKFYLVNIVFLQTDTDVENKTIKDFFGVDRFNHLVIDRKEDQTVEYKATLKTNKEYSSTQLDDFLKENKFILKIERCDDI
ncbi:MAG: MgtC/SapB family protein [Clostridia bacterium]|nr:MgtC/SapB family protein [Clostridia bacterium]